jgi:hypothetical protein
MTNTATKPADYLHIAVWGRQLGSYGYYIADQQEKAFKARAPINAIYEKWGVAGPTGMWVTADEIASDDVRKCVEDGVETLRAALKK